MKLMETINQLTHTGSWSMYVLLFILYMRIYIYCTVLIFVLFFCWDFGCWVRIDGVLGWGGSIEKIIIPKK